MESPDWWDIIECSSCADGTKVARKWAWELYIGDDNDVNNKPLTRLNSCKPIKMSIVDPVGGSSPQTLASADGQSGTLDETDLEW